MTRINCVPPEELHYSHLGAEYYELPRAVGYIIAAHQRGECPDDKRNPKAYTLGAGHVRFFYNKLTYLRKRFALLVAECQRRGRKTSFTELPAADLPREWCNDWTPDDAALALNRNRLKQRMPKMQNKSLMDKLLEKAASAPKPPEGVAQRRPIVRVRATGEGRSNLQAASIRAKIMAHIATMPNKTATVAELDAALGVSTRGHLQKLIQKNHLEHA
jgi:deoxyribonuclease (pyrimidine dimer)